MLCQIFVHLYTWEERNSVEQSFLTKETTQWLSHPSNKRPLGRESEVAVLTTICTSLGLHQFLISRRKNLALTLTTKHRYGIQILECCARFLCIYTRGKRETVCSKVSFLRKQLSEWALSPPTRDPVIGSAKRWPLQQLKLSIIS